MSRLRHAGMAVLAGALAAGMLAIAGPALQGEADAANTSAANAATLRPVSDFARIRDRQARAVALFEEAGKVIASPRCMNCHPAGDRPTQTDSMRPHQPLVVRGEGGHGPLGGLACNTCHHDANYDPARVPGNPKWALAPLEMAWQGKTLGQICVQLKDRTRNGDMDMAKLVHHMAEDELVGWGWNPGAGRTPAPGTQKQFGALIKAWADAGAACPKG
ncbi:Isoquinoline 1-oxidoreductase subunit [Rhodopseudomonas palustris]|uniref:Isoquinoline 1-oxidoreductase subunit n=1 Tax=Rhodopseudomonas palustris TaxID=1076 RepID=UPI002ACF0720|nr:Isoquinoline 1-oxidoreductase subunit [Rhodopseudomonas palustris]WQH01281.1 Isoquinoline 1-oxidoreductase subunit [Rhodopseudomonas palustris]